ncbi:hypothetical protein P4132_31215 [Pseudomonas aeruginosa]|nr:hypothetical protein [Pseudomonas aeruginosa]
MATRYSASPKARQAHLARTIECNQAMVRALAANLALKLQSGTPPARPQRWIPERFILDCPA